MRAPAHGTSVSIRRSALPWLLAVLVLVLVRLEFSSPADRRTALRAVLVIAGIGEALAFVANAFTPRRFATANGRTYDPVFHGVMQDFGFYNLATSALFLVAAVDPTRMSWFIAIVAGAYAVHAATHLARFCGLYYGGGHPIATRPSAFELRDGLQLVVVLAGLALFAPMVV